MVNRNRILYDKDTKKAKGVEIIDAETNKTYDYFAKIVFVNASALNSAWVLMNSATDVWEGGLGSSSGELGHNVMDHHLGVGAGGRIEGFEDKYYFGRRANGIYIPRYRNLNGEKRDYIRGFGYQGSGSRSGWSRDIAEMSIGAALKMRYQNRVGWNFGMGGFGETLPYHDNKITLDKTNKDKWGLPIVSV
jgi:choline dehydrogenase-like flavoprotein